MLLLLSAAYLDRKYVSRLVLVQFILLMFLGFVLVRVAFCSVLRTRSEHGFARRVVLVGRGRLVHELARKIQRHPEMLSQVVGFLSPDDGTSALDSGLSDGTESCSALQIADLLSEQRVDEIILALQEASSRDLLNLTALCRERGIQVS